jgi:triosephosphate isomerase
MIIALNNKCNLNKTDFNNYLSELSSIKTSHKIILCPSTINIPEFNLQSISLGAQNVSSNTQGAFTGEVSASQLKSYNVEYTIIGHSERREYQKESNEEINKKIKRLFQEDIIPILCVGETKEEREAEKVEKIISEEILTAIKDLTEEEKNKIIIAYEPIWSIGTGIIPTIAEIESVFSLIKNILPNNKILYGGSANEKNIDTLNKSKMIDGYLLGGLSLKPKELNIFLQKLN